MTESKELKLAKFLLWKIMFRGEGPMEQIWKAQDVSVKKHWRQIAHDSLEYMFHSS